MLPTASAYQWEGYRDTSFSTWLISRHKMYLVFIWCFPGSAHGKESACNVGGPGSILGSGRSPGVGNVNLFQCSCLENSMDRGALWATVHGVTKSWTWHRLSTHNLLITKMYFCVWSRNWLICPDSFSTRSCWLLPTVNVLLVAGNLLTVSLVRH